MFYLICVCFIVIFSPSLLLSPAPPSLSLPPPPPPPFPPLSIYPAPEIFLTPSGNTSIPAGAFFVFSCLTTVKIPLLPTELLLNGQLINELPLIIPSSEPITQHPFIRQPYIFQELSVTDNGTVIQCVTFVTSPAQQLSITSEPAILFVFGECDTHNCRLRAMHNVMHFIISAHQTIVQYLRS